MQVGEGEPGQEALATSVLYPEIYDKENSFAYILLAPYVGDFGGRTTPATRNTSNSDFQKLGPRSGAVKRSRSAHDPGGHLGAGALYSD